MVSSVHDACVSACGLMDDCTGMLPVRLYGCTHCLQSKTGKKLQKSESSQEIQGQAQRDYREGGETAVCQQLDSAGWKVLYGKVTGSCSPNGNASLVFVAENSVHRGYVYEQKV